MGCNTASITSRDEELGYVELEAVPHSRENGSKMLGLESVLVLEAPCVNNDIVMTLVEVEAGVDGRSVREGCEW